MTHKPKRFPSDWLDWFRSKVSIEDVISRFVELERRIGYRSVELVGRCPFHDETKLSFVVPPDKGFYHCFGCGAHGDVIGFTMRTMSLSFDRAIATLAKHVGGIEVPRSPDGVSTESFADLSDLPLPIPYLRAKGIRRAAKPFLRELLFRAPPLEELIGEVVTLTRRGNKFVGLCPFHHEHAASFFVRPANHKTCGYYRCHGCGASGNHFAFLRRYSLNPGRTPISMKDAVLEVAQRAGVAVPLKIVKALE